MQEPEYTISALVSQRDIGGRCIFRDVVSALMTPWVCPKLSDCWRRRPLTDLDYRSLFAVNAFKAIIREIQTIWLVLKVKGHFVGTVFIVANVHRYDINSLLQHSSKQLLLSTTALSCLLNSKNDKHGDFLYSLALTKYKYPRQPILMQADKIIRKGMQKSKTVW